MRLLRSGKAALTISILAWSSAQAQIPSATGECAAHRMKETTPSSDFTLLEGGQLVRHETTGLDWRRCAEGMTWSGIGCAGTARVMTWFEALRHARSQPGWRLPNLNELLSIVEECRMNPAINEQVFPNTPPFSFWSATPYAGASDFAWRVGFNYGHDHWSFKNDSRGLRLVRGGQ